MSPPRLFLVIHPVVRDAARLDIYDVVVPASGHIDVSCRYNCALEDVVTQVGELRTVDMEERENLEIVVMAEGDAHRDQARIARLHEIISDARRRRDPILRHFHVKLPQFATWMMSSDRSSVREWVRRDDEGEVVKSGVEPSAAQGVHEGFYEDALFAAAQKGGEGRPRWGIGCSGAPRCVLRTLYHLVR